MIRLGAKKAAVLVLFGEEAVRTGLKQGDLGGCCPKSGMIDNGLG